MPSRPGRDFLNHLRRHLRRLSRRLPLLALACRRAAVAASGAGAGAAADGDGAAAAGDGTVPGWTGDGTGPGRAGGAGADPETLPAETLRSALGFPPCRRAAAPSAPPALRGAVRAVPAAPAAGAVAAPPDLAGRDGACMVSVCTRNYLYLARTAIASFRRQHPDMPAFLGIVDWDGAEPLALPGATLLPCGGLGIAGFDYLALKYNALEMCGAMKPFLLDHVLRQTRCRKIVFLDSDILVFAPFERLLAALDGHDFVVTPHTLAPPPHPERFWERPTLGDLAFAGQLNSGLFGLRATSEALAFLDVWRDLVTRPGAFLLELGGQTEQNSFNWVTSFVERVHVLRDPAYNVGYWSLHDRSVRHAWLDDPCDPEAGDRWAVDGKPLVAFHFSGYSLDSPYQLSRHDRRHSLYLLPSIARLIQLYAERLQENGAAEDRRLGYRFDAFPSGIPVDERMRRLWKQHETVLAPGVTDAAEPSPWTAEGEARTCEALLSPIPGTGSLLPILFDAVYDERADLRQAFPDARLRPDELWQWIAGHGIYECGYQEIYDRHRPVLPSRHGVVALSRARRRWPELFSGLASPLGADRRRLLARLDAAGRTTLAAWLRSAALEQYYVSPLWTVRRIVEERADVRETFPDLLYADAAPFRRWLETWAARDHCVPAGAAAAFAARAEGRSLARIFSFLNRSRPFMERWPLGLVGEGRMDLAAGLLAALRHGAEYDADDVVMYLWTMELKPWAGLALTFELAANACRTPSPLLDEGQEHLLGPLLARDRGFGAALARYRQEHGTARHRREERQIRSLQRPRGAAATVFDALQAAAEGGHRPAAGGPLPELRGVNLFGYHRSPIGLGSLSRGLAAALAGAGARVQPNVLGNPAMDADLRPADFVRTYDHRLDTNLFVSYPHLHDLLLPMLPEHVTRCRRNVVYLAWEQRDGSPYWPQVFKDFDAVWALSDFAAASFRRFMRREVRTVPCVLDCAGLPAPSDKRDFGLEPSKLTFLYVFDANSSIERKNPEAVMRAFAAAFTRKDDVCLVLRIGNGGRLHHRETVKRLLALAPPGLDVRVVFEPMEHADLLRLVGAADCYVSLHRAEGFGYTCAEAMAYGLPVIATGYSGNLQFMDRRNSLLVACKEAPVAVADGPYQRGSMWAEPDVEHAADLMRRVYERPDLARAIGERARADVRRTLSPAAVSRIALSALGWQAPETGCAPAVPEPVAAAGRAAGVPAAALAAVAGPALAPAVSPAAVAVAGVTPATGPIAAAAAAAAVTAVIPAVAAAAARQAGAGTLGLSFGTR